MKNRRYVFPVLGLIMLFQVFAKALGQELIPPPSQPPSREMTIVSFPVVEDAIQRRGVNPQDLEVLRSLIQQPFSDFRDLRPGLAAVLIARRGEIGVIPAIRQRFYEYLSAADEGPEYFLYALYFLSAPGVRDIANQYLDTLRMQRFNYLALPQVFGTLRVLVKLGDFSRFDACDQATSLGVQQGRLVDPRLLEEFAKRSELRSRVFQDFQLILTEGNWLDRRDAVTSLSESLRDYSGTQDVLRQVVQSGSPIHADDSDLAFQTRSQAIVELQDKYSDLLSVQIAEQTASSSTDTLTVAFASTLLLRFNSPFALAAMGRIYSNMTDSYFKSFFDLDDYKPPIMLPWEPVIGRVDSMVGFLPQVVSLGWLSDNAFLFDLEISLQRAHEMLDSGDSVDCARAIKAFQHNIDFVFIDSLNPDPRKVTIEGWKFLYYNAQYILDRLPAIPPSPVIASLNPATAYAGGNGFSLSVKGRAFAPASAVLWNGSSRTTSFAADSVLQATILASDIAIAGTASVAVVNPGNDTSNTISFTITQPPSGLSVRLVNSIGTNLTSGSLQYYDGSWKDAVNNNDGTFHVNTTLATVSLRMMYEGGSQTKSNVAVGPNVVAFQTVNAQVKLQNSQGALIDTGTVQYYYSSWKPLGNTVNGVASKELLPANYTFRMTYATATNDKQQDIGANATVVFSTVNAAVQLKNSAGSLLDQGTVQYYFSSWQSFGHTMNGVATAELLPGTYTFRMGYASATKDKQQNIGTNPTVVFNTVNATVQLKNSLGAFIDQGTVQYYFSSWKALGPTMNGVAMKELLPASYTFRMAYATVTNDKVQDVSTNSTVSFSTVLCTVTVKNSQGQPVDGAQVSYYFSSWLPIGATVGGQVTKELLPASLTFRETIGSATQNKVQNIGTNALVEFVTQ